MLRMLYNFCSFEITLPLAALSAGLLSYGVETPRFMESDLCCLDSWKHFVLWHFCNHCFILIIIISNLQKVLKWKNKQSKKKKSQINTLLERHIIDFVIQHTLFWIFK